MTPVVNEAMAAWSIMSAARGVMNAQHTSSEFEGQCPIRWSERPPADPSGERPWGGWQPPDANQWPRARAGDRELSGVAHPQRTGYSEEVLRQFRSIRPAGISRRVDPGDKTHRGWPGDPRELWTRCGPHERGTALHTATPALCVNDTVHPYLVCCMETDLIPVMSNVPPAGAALFLLLICGGVGVDVLHTRPPTDI